MQNDIRDISAINWYNAVIEMIKELNHEQVSSPRPLVNCLLSGGYTHYVVSIPRPFAVLSKTAKQ